MTRAVSAPDPSLFGRPIPKAPAVLQDAGGIPVWRVNQCPWCGNEHLHGGNALGHRLAHCIGGPLWASYFLVDAEQLS